MELKVRSLLTALALALLLAGAQAQPVVPGATTSIYASVPQPITLGFAPDGTLCVGYNPDDTFNAYKIHRVGPGGSPVTPFGKAGIVDPDTVLVDVVGTVSGTPGSVIVGGYVDARAARFPPSRPAARSARCSGRPPTTGIRARSSSIRRGASSSRTDRAPRPWSPKARPSPAPAACFRRTCPSALTRGNPFGCELLTDLET